MRILLLGTGAFPVPVFRAVCGSRHDVAAVATQPARASKGSRPVPNPVLDVAREFGRPVLQPDSINAPEALAELKDFEAELFLVASYGQLLSRAFLELPPRGAFNVHASLLPRHRGASPVEHALLAGDAETGISLFRIVRKLDAGPLAARASTPILPGETAGELEQRLAELAVAPVLRLLDDAEHGTLLLEPQDESLATYAPKLSKEQGAVDWSLPAEQIERQVRAFQPWPTAFGFLSRASVPGAAAAPRRRIVFRRALAVDGAGADSNPPGTVVSVEGGGIDIQTGSGVLRVEELQPEGKRTMTAAEFVRGRALAVGDRFYRHSAGDG